MFSILQVCKKTSADNNLACTKWAQKAVIYRVITPFTGGYNPSYPFRRLFTGVTTPFITSMGPSCTKQNVKYTRISIFSRLLGAWTSNRSGIQQGEAQPPGLRSGWWKMVGLLDIFPKKMAWHKLRESWNISRSLTACLWKIWQTYNIFSFFGAQVFHKLYTRNLWLYTKNKGVRSRYLGVIRLFVGYVSSDHLTPVA